MIRSTIRTFLMTGSPSESVANEQQRSTEHGIPPLIEVSWFVPSNQPEADEILNVHVEWRVTEVHCVPGTEFVPEIEATVVPPLGVRPGD